MISNLPVLLLKSLVLLPHQEVKLELNNELSKKFSTDLIVRTTNNDNLLNIITKAASDNITIDSVFTISKGEYKIYTMTVLVENVEKLNKFIVDLSNLSYVSEVERLMK